MAGLVQFALFNLLIGCVVCASVQKNDCPPDQYYDHGTDYCEPCSDICINARIMGTENDCKSLCPDFHVPVPVPIQQKSPPADGNAATVPDITMIILVVASVVVLVSGLAGGLFLYRRKNQPQTRHTTNPAAQQTTIEQPRAGVQEEHGAQVQRLIHSCPEGISSSGGCDPRSWLRRGPHAEETTTGRTGPQAMALLGSRNGSGSRPSERFIIRDPIYRPSAQATASRV